MPPQAVAAARLERAPDTPDIRLVLAGPEARGGRAPNAGGGMSAPAAQGYRRDPPSGGPAPAGRPEHIEEKLLAQVREAARQELLKGPAAERFADDIMRRIDKRLRIERERRGL